MSEEGETVADRIETVRKMTPPKAGRKARHGYVSKDDFAEVLGVSRTRIYAWTSPKEPSYPEPVFRERLAQLSRGRYSPDDFARPRDRDRLSGLEARVGRLDARQETGIEEVAVRLAEIEARLERLERQASRRRRDAQ